MTGTIFVTDAQVRAAQMLVDRDWALGREPDPATLKIAHARPESSAGRTPDGPSTPPPAAVSFWDALDSAEREALRSVASWRTFAAGSTLMQQGEPADQVIVVLGGRTKISVDKGGKEIILAIRGLGQLVGERAAFKGSMRSATVTALELVWAIVISSADFATFITDHPRVTNILHDQLYDRLVEGRTEYGHAEVGQNRLPDAPVGGAVKLGPVGDEPADDYPRRHLDVPDGENCTVVRFDVAGYGTEAPGDRLLIREALSAMIAAALQGIPEIWTLDQGDGFLTVVPPSVSTAEVMSRLLKELPAAVERHNRSRRGSVPIQLRLAINVGPVFGDIAGASGEAIIVASQLLEAPHFVDAIADDAILAIVISPFVFETVIKPGPDLNEVASYAQIPAEVRGSTTTAWMKVISGDPTAPNTRP